MLGRDRGLDRLALVGAQPARVAWAIGKPHQHRETERDRRQPFEQEQPLPSLKAGRAVQREQPSRERPADDAGERSRGHEPRDGAGALGGRKPAGEIQDDARKEARFCRAEKESQREEAPRAAHEHRGRRHEPPRNHDARDPDPHANPIEQEVAGNLEEDIRDEEHARPEAVNGCRETEGGVHLQRRESDVDAVEIRH